MCRFDQSLSFGKLIPSSCIVCVCESELPGRENSINMRMHACMRAKCACARTHKSTLLNICNAMQCNAIVHVWVYVFMLRTTLDECMYWCSIKNVQACDWPYLSVCTQYTRSTLCRFEECARIVPWFRMVNFSVFSSLCVHTGANNHNLVIVL